MNRLLDWILTLRSLAPMKAALKVGKNERIETYVRAEKHLLYLTDKNKDTLLDVRSSTERQEVTSHHVRRDAAAPRWCMTFFFLTKRGTRDTATVCFCLENVSASRLTYFGKNSFGRGGTSQLGTSLCGECCSLALAVPAPAHCDPRNLGETGNKILCCSDCVR